MYQACIAAKKGPVRTIDTLATGVVFAPWRDTNLLIPSRALNHNGKSFARIVALGPLGMALDSSRAQRQSPRRQRQLPVDPLQFLKQSQSRYPVEFFPFCPLVGLFKLI